jgi:hypothetical protein
VIKEESRPTPNEPGEVDPVIIEEGLEEIDKYKDAEVIFQDA